MKAKTATKNGKSNGNGDAKAKAAIKVEIQKTYDKGWEDGVWDATQLLNKMLKGFGKQFSTATNKIAA